MLPPASTLDSMMLKTIDQRSPEKEANWNTVSIGFVSPNKEIKKKSNINTPEE